MDELTLQTVHIGGSTGPVTVSASRTSCPHLVITPRIGTLTDTRVPWYSPVD